MGMFGIVRLNRRRVTVISVAGFVVFLVICLLMLRAGGPDTVQVRGDSYPLTVQDEGDVEAFLTVCGYTPQGCVGDRTITVPKNWNSVYTEYNALQARQGLTLVPYKGKEARELIYAAADTNDYATVLIADGRIIAAHRGTMLQGDAIKPLITP